LSPNTVDVYTTVLANTVAISTHAARAAHGNI
jgi:hypothetical protein